VIRVLGSLVNVDLDPSHSAGEARVRGAVIARSLIAQPSPGERCFACRAAAHAGYRFSSTAQEPAWITRSVDAPHDLDILLRHCPAVSREDRAFATRSSEQWYPTQLRLECDQSASTANPNRHSGSESRSCTLVSRLASARDVAPGALQSRYHCPLPFVRNATNTSRPVRATPGKAGRSGPSFVLVLGLSGTQQSEQSLGSGKGTRLPS
jgi:hypothetical protein